MQIDLTLLTADQRKEYETYILGFTSTFWQKVSERVEGLSEQIQRSYDGAVGEQQLGRMQGTRSALLYVLGLQALVEQEFLHLTGQLGQGSLSEDPVIAGDWRA